MTRAAGSEGAENRWTEKLKETNYVLVWSQLFSYVSTSRRTRFFRKYILTQTG